MKVTVRVFGDLREHLQKETSVSLPEKETMHGLLRLLGQRFPAFLPKILDENGRLRPYVIILSNGRDVKSLDGLDTGLADEDVIAIFPPVAGG